MSSLDDLARSLFVSKSKFPTASSVESPPVRGEIAAGMAWLHPFSDESVRRFAAAAGLARFQLGA